MSEEPTVIYTARTMQEAHLLKNRLAEERIKAVVLNEALEGGSGVDAVGWTTAARVAVAQSDARRARRIAMEFERAGSSAPGEADNEATAMLVDDWPRCPECGEMRLTRCPVCHTAGTDFAPADMEFTLISGPQGGAAAACTGCAPGGCAATDVPADADAEMIDHRQEDESPVLLLMCHTCDEPFRPEHLRVCEWCGHEFPDGFETEMPSDPVEEIEPRVIAVAVGLLVLLLLIAVYFILVV